MEIHVYHLTDTIVRVMIHGSEYKKLFAGNFKTASFIDAITQAFHLIEQGETTNRKEE